MTLKNTSPIVKFQQWFDLALEKNSKSNAMCLSTSYYGICDSRMVLLKSYDERGFVFYTNYESNKGLDLDANDNCSLLFYWPEIGRQVRMQGRAVKTSREESEAYWKTRPLMSRAGSLVSNQSQEIMHRIQLIFAALRQSARGVEYSDKWGGYRVVPTQIEFWKNGLYRLHSREQWNLVRGQWTTKILAP